MALAVISILLLITVLEVNSEDLCGNNKSNSCKCYRGVDLEFQCPSIHHKFLIHLKQNVYLKITCKNLDSFNMSLLPKHQAENISYVSFEYCPMPEDNFLSILNEFKINKFDRLQLKSIRIPKFSNNKTISRNMFYGLSFLKDLTLWDISYKLDDDILDFLPNLLSFELNQSEINNITTIKFPSSLKGLYLTSNLLVDIPIGLFQNINKLQILRLHHNKIKHIRKGAFTGLNKLKSLDLNSNDITDIEEGSFDDLKNLIVINLRSNKLRNIKANIFKFNTNLTTIIMKNNPDLLLPDYIFSNLRNLHLVNLEDSRIKNIPEHIFSGSPNITTIILRKNRLKTLPESIFRGLAKLEKLDLSINEITLLPNNLFLSLLSLRKLYLGFNNIFEINNELFNNAKNMEHLLLNNNKIASIDIDSFQKLGNLKQLMLNHNLIETFPEYNGFIYLEEVDLSYNKIKKIQLFQIISLPSKNLQSINLRNNEIEVISFNNVNTFSNLNKMNLINIDLNNNPLSCNCENYDLVRYCQKDTYAEVKKRVDLKVENINCTKPPIFQHIKISKLNSQWISCEIPMLGCPKECRCLWRPYNEFRVIDCSNRNLTTFPKIDGSFRNLELDLTGNNIQSGLNLSLGYENVKYLFLSNNKLKELKWIPPGIEKLTLNQNELTNLEPGLLEIMNKAPLRLLKLSHNPWSCGCSALELQIFITANYQMVNSSDVICSDNKLLVEKRELCKVLPTRVLIIVLPILSLLLLTTVSLILYIYYKQEIRVWLYSKNISFCEKQLDEDKIYDIFICYAHQEEHFVVQKLLPELESGPKPFKTCIHIRDWEPGEMISTHITNSVINSRRTLVVLSNNFLESAFGLQEFEIAHTKALEEGRTRIIVIKYGDLDEQKIGSNLKAYLTTNTYIEWGKPYFWNKLNYALNHLHKNKSCKSNQKHANMILKIDDMFELTNPPLKLPESTPSVISSDPSLPNPFNFTHVNTETDSCLKVPLVVNR